MKKCKKEASEIKCPIITAVIKNPFKKSIPSKYLFSLISRLII
ncbi:MAG: hypothetical protein ACFFAQ_05550 [Promethearchaeota archaeon]